MYLNNVLIFPHISITMTPHVLHRRTSSNLFLRQIDIGSIQQLQVLLSCGTKSKNKQKISIKKYLKDLSPEKFKTVVSNFYLKSY